MAHKFAIGYYPRCYSKADSLEPTNYYAPEPLEARVLLAATLVKDITEGAAGSVPRNITVVNGALFFTAANQLWKSDGTNAGTVPIAPLTFQADDLDGAAVLNNLFIYAGTSNFQTYGDLWRSDGTPGGTSLLKSNVFDSEGEMFSAGGYVLFSGREAATGFGLYRTDGTAQGTMLLKNSLNPKRFVQFKGETYFLSGSGNGSLWKTDGTPQGTLEVNHSISTTERPVVLKDSLYFYGCDSTNGCELWSTDGSGPGSMIASLNPGTANAGIFRLTVSNGALYFSATTPNTGREFFKSDGTSAGTSLLKDTVPGPSGAVNVGLADVNGTLFFFSDAKLWKSTGTPAATVMVADLAASTFSLGELKAANGLLFFSTTSNAALWISDGSAGGTVKLLNHEPTLGSVPHLFIATLNDRAYFRAIDPAYGSELFTLAPPTARATGPYTAGVGSTVRLNAASSTDPDPAATLTFAWDLDNDNIFGETGAAAGHGDEVGATPTFSSANYAVGTYPVSLRVTSSSGLTSQLTTNVRVRDAHLFGTPGNDTFRTERVGAAIVFIENGIAFSMPYSPTMEIIVDGGDGDDYFELVATSRFTFNAGAGNDTARLMTGSYQMFADAASFGLENILGGPNGTLTLNSSQHLSVLAGDSIRMTANGSRVLRAAQLSFRALDLADNALIITDSDLATVTNQIKTGLTSPEGIYSSLASATRRVGAIANGTQSNPLYTSFAGESNLTGGEILVRYTIVGDLNLDTQVTISDFIDLASHFNQSGTWGEGDINYDGVITVADFIDLASHFNQSFASAAAPQPALASSAQSLSTIEVSRADRTARGHHRRPLRHQRRTLRMPRPAIDGIHGARFGSPAREG